MLNLAENHQWSLIINLMIDSFFQNGTTICILWNSEIQWKMFLDHQFHAFVHIDSGLLERFHLNNVYDFESKQKDLDQIGFEYDELILKLAVSIEASYCEGFIAFQQDIPLMADAFFYASRIASWHSLRNQFLFCYYEHGFDQPAELFQNRLFEDQPDILIIEADSLNSSHFRLKTNQFLRGTNEKTYEQLNLIDTFDSRNATILDLRLLKMLKLNNLQHRPVVIGAFDYRPFVALDYTLQPQMYDHAADNPLNAIHADGTEIRVVRTFCELHNCTLELDSSEKSDWGMTFDNGSSYGLVGLLQNDNIDIALGAFYDLGFKILDFTAFLGRSGVTCLVPVPQRLVSWQLPLLPFQPFLWLGLIGLLLLEVASLFATKCFGAFMDSTLKSQWRENFNFAYKTTFKLAVSQSTVYIITRNSLRVLLVSCYLINIIITAIYGAGLAAVLTLPTLDEAADSIERMAKFDLKWMGQSALWVENIKDAKDKSLEKIVPNFHVATVDEMREQVQLGLEGFVVERLAYGHFGNVDYITIAAMERLKLMTDDLYFQYTGGYVRRCWAFEEDFNQFVYWYHSGGFGQFWESQISATYMNKVQQGRIETSKFTAHNTGPIKLGFENFAGLVFIWIAGISLSIFVFIIELSLKQQKRYVFKTSLTSI